MWCLPVKLNRSPRGEAQDGCPRFEQTKLVDARRRAPNGPVRLARGQHPPSRRRGEHACSELAFARSATAGPRPQPAIRCRLAGVRRGRVRRAHHAGSSTEAAANGGGGGAWRALPYAWQTAGGRLALAGLLVLPGRSPVCPQVVRTADDQVLPSGVPNAVGEVLLAARRRARQWADAEKETEAATNREQIGESAAG